MGGTPGRMSLTVKFGIAVSTADALPSAFVVYRDDLCSLIDRCADLGYDGVELALRSADQVDVGAIRRRLGATGLEIPCISSGQVFAADGLYFTHPDESIRRAAVDRITGMIRLAAEFGAKVNTGRVRGIVAEGESAETTAGRYLDCLHRCADAAEPLGVELIVEPVNRYEVNFINNCAEGLAIVRRAARRSVKLMPDLFHMNIEDPSFRESFEAARDAITYVHVADSNRLAPGWGHLPFSEIFGILSDIGYQGYLTAEILPQPDPDSAARQAIRFLFQELKHAHDTSKPSQGLHRGGDRL
jgi:sugar phosphate isomerase/epimerase